MIKEEKKTVTAEEKTAKKKQRKKLFLKILLGIVAVIVVFILCVSLVSLIGNNANMAKAKSFENAGTRQLELEEYEDGFVNIYCDDELKVMQLTDVHLGGGWMSLKKDSMALNAVAAMITEEKPDLVIATGDVAYPIMFQAGTINNFNGMKLFAELMESLGVYWTIAFGNHDVEANSIHSYEDVLELLSGEDYPHCLLSTAPGDVDGYSNHVINVVNSENKVTRSLIMIDSHAYAKGHIPVINWAYDNVHDNQIEWYSQVVKNLADENGVAVPSSVFLHIPLTEYRDAWNEYVENGRKDTENVKFIYGIAGEDGELVYCGSAEDGLFEAMLDGGSTDTVFCGHDHFNRFSVDYKGIKLTYGMSIDYLAYVGIYKVGAQRGCTMITYGTDGSVEYSAENYYQDKYSTVYEKEAVEMS